MMEHIRQFDWCSSQPDSSNFLDEKDIDNCCVTEQILRNKFFNPLLSSDSESENSQSEINWDEIFSNRSKQKNKTYRSYVPGYRQMPPHPKLSALSRSQQYQCLKVICEDNPDILPSEPIPKPTVRDRKMFEELKPTILKEQGEYIEWARTMWNNGHCIRALRPKPLVEMIYEADFKVKANELRSFPRLYELVAQIPLSSHTEHFVMTHEKDLIEVDIKGLPHVTCPKVITKKISIMNACPVPEPCDMHPCRFVLPGEKSLSILPLTEIHRELAQYAHDNGARCVASESALRSLLQQDQHWLLPLSVCEVLGPDGEKTNVIVLGSRFAARRESAAVRTYCAITRLLEYSLIPSSEQQKLLRRSYTTREESVVGGTGAESSAARREDPSSDEEDGALFIDAPTGQAEEEEVVNSMTQSEQEADPYMDVGADADVNGAAGRTERARSGLRPFECTCRETASESPAPRSFAAWRVADRRQGAEAAGHRVVVHCARRLQNDGKEVVLEPIPEYQIDLGGSRTPESSARCSALALHLRHGTCASLVRVRVDAPTGEVVAFESPPLPEAGGALLQAGDAVYSMLDQLQGLLPGHYILGHEPTHGANAMLYAPRSSSGVEPAAVTGCVRSLVLQFEGGQLNEADEAQALKTAPTLEPVLLPAHKARKVLPCCFTYFETQVAKEPKKPTNKQKTPPQAFKWPKKRGRKKKTT